MPRGRYDKAPKRKPKPTPRARVTNARRVALAAQQEAKRLLADETQNRSTRTRASYKVQAEALDRVEAILDGRDR
jgi:hypothetical protein